MTSPSDILFSVGDLTPQPPTPGKILLYAKNNLFYQLDSNGVETQLGGGGNTNTGIDGGTPSSNYGGTTPIIGGAPNTNYSGTTP